MILQPAFLQKFTLDWHTKYFIYEYCSLYSSSVQTVVLQPGSLFTMSRMRVVRLGRSHLAGCDPV